MATFSIENFGCRATQADAATIEQQLLARGYALEESHGRADVVVLNTCTVTAAADRQARDAVRHIHRANPSARIIVTGCYAQRAPEELSTLEGVAFVVGNAHQAEIPRLAGELTREALPAPSGSLDFVPLAAVSAEPLTVALGPAKILTGDIFEQTSLEIAPTRASEGEKTRPTLKIQDGCSNRCAYCVIPFVRGKSRSISPDAVLEEVRRLAAAGTKEIVLSGINLGSYGRDLAPRVNLRNLIERIQHETALERLRLSSIEPMDVTQDLIELVAATDRIARHFHIPLQSGSDRILRAMHRWYRTVHYARRIELLHELLPDAAVGADVIAGFPGETEEDHHATVDFITELPFSYLHVFAFSARPGTGAAPMSDQVPLATIQRRARELRMLGAEKNAAFRASQIGARLCALTLHRAGENWTEALSGNYLKVRVAGRWPANQWVDVRFTGSDAPTACQPRDGILRKTSEGKGLEGGARG